ncbi:MAG: nuclear transport factor 2 family protein [Planctomycetes bacterium]|nr:nuclear transport factor 2 family protein [Planctomycetota bacterium]
MIRTMIVTVAIAMSADPPTERAAIQKVLDDQAAAWNKGDLPAFMKGYLESEDLSFFSGNNKTKGWKATLERYQKKYQGEGKEMGKLTFKEMSIELLGDDHALVRGRFHLQLKNEAPTGIFTLIMRKTNAGWRIIHDHTSS